MKKAFIRSRHSRINNFRSHHVTVLLLATSVGRITKTIMRPTGRVIIAVLNTDAYILTNHVVCDIYLSFRASLAEHECRYPGIPGGVTCRFDRI